MLFVFEFIVIFYSYPADEHEGGAPGAGGYEYPIDEVPLYDDHHLDDSRIRDASPRKEEPPRSESALKELETGFHSKRELMRTPAHGRREAPPPRGGRSYY